MDTLKSILFVKHNLKYDCIEFHALLKSKPDLLRKISTQDKYNPKVTDSTSNDPTRMSIDSVRNE